MTLPQCDVAWNGVTDDVMNSVSEVVEHIFTHYPQVGRRAGRHELDGRLPAVAPRDLGELDALLATASAGLDALPPNVDPEVRADVSTAVRVLIDERFRVAALEHHLAAGIRDVIGQFLTERQELADGPLAGLAEDARAACLRFADAVGKTAPASALMGPDQLAGYLMAAEGVDRPLDELLDDVDADGAVS